MSAIRAGSAPLVARVLASLGVAALVARVLAALGVVMAAAVLLGAAAAPEAAGQQDRGRYRPPVSAPIAERYRAPAHRYGPGNRGVDYVTAPGTPVHASSSGRVTFAGPVGGRLVVVIGHPDGLRTTYLGLATAAVAAGTAVEGGQVVGTATGRLHFGVRDGGTYLDPETVFTASAPGGSPSGAGGGVRLVPTDGGSPRARAPT